MSKTLPVIILLASAHAFSSLCQFEFNWGSEFIGPVTFDTWGLLVEIRCEERQEVAEIVLKMKNSIRPLKMIPAGMFSKRFLSE